MTCLQATQSASLNFPPEGLQYLIQTVAAEVLAQRTGGIAQGMILEAWANIPTTTHPGRSRSSGQGGVVDGHGRVSGYQNMLVCDGSKVPANPRVNPSLTITAMSEHAKSAIPIASH